MNYPGHELLDFVHVVDDALPLPLCADLITTFDHAQGQPRHSVFEGVRDFHDLLINSDDAYRLMMPTVWGHFMGLVQGYLSNLQIPPQQIDLSKCGAEGFRIKYYQQGVGQFLKHVDVGDHQSARRALAVFWYLNDVDEGGETVFYNQQGDVIRTIKPKAGRAVLFPPMWMFPHAGLIPVSSGKYLLSGYLHYQ